jgi:hypothetical protein
MHSGDTADPLHSLGQFSSKRAKFFGFKVKPHGISIPGNYRLLVEKQSSHEDFMPERPKSSGGSIRDVGPVDACFH